MQNLLQSLAIELHQVTQSFDPVANVVLWIARICAVVSLAAIVWILWQSGLLLKILFRDFQKWRKIRRQKGWSFYATFPDE